MLGFGELSLRSTPVQDHCSNLHAVLGGGGGGGGVPFALVRVGSSQKKMAVHALGTQK